MSGDLFGRVLADLRARGAHVQATDAGRLRLEVPHGALGPAEAEWLAAHKAELLEALRAGPDPAAATLADLHRAGFTVTLIGDFNLSVEPSIARLPTRLFNRLVDQQDAIRAHLRRGSEGRE